MPRKSQLTFLTQTFNHLLTGVMVLDSQFGICYTNATLEQILSASQTQIMSANIFDILLDKDTKLGEKKRSQQRLKAQFLHTSQLYQAYIRHDCTIMGAIAPILVDYGVSPMEIDQQIFYVVELWAKDNQSRIEQEQQQHAQHHITRQLIRSMAHEVKNPLAGILGASQLLEKHLVKHDITEGNPLSTMKSDKIDTYLNIIMEETRRLNHLVNQLLGSPKLPTWQRLNIHEPLEYVLNLIRAQSSSIELVRDYDLSLPEVVGDKDQLVQVFLNLINNAMQALQENAVQNPCITLRTRIVYQQTIGDIRHKSVLAVSIIDNGMGIESKLLPTIFYPLVTGRATGTGLGLALVHDIVERHQGLITVQSEQGRTEFQVLLPFELEKIHN